MSDQETGLAAIDEFLRNTELWGRATLIDAEAGIEDRVILQKTGNNTVRVCLDVHANGIKPLPLTVEIIRMLAKNSGWLENIIEYCNRLSANNVIALQRLLGAGSEKPQPQAQGYQKPKPAQDTQPQAQEQQSQGNKPYACPKCGGKLRMVFFTDKETGKKMGRQKCTNKECNVWVGQAKMSKESKPKQQEESGEVW